MAAVVGTILDVHSFGTPAGPKATTAGASIEECIIDVTFAGTYASAGDSTTSAVGTAIGAVRRDGRSYTVLHAMCVAPGDLNGTKIGAQEATVSGNVITAGLSIGDMTTEWADGLMSTAWNEGVKFRVMYTAS